MLSDAFIHAGSDARNTPRKATWGPVTAQGVAERIDHWSLTSLQQRLVRTGGRLVKHARYYWLLLAEGHLARGDSAAADLGAAVAYPHFSWVLVHYPGVRFTKIWAKSRRSIYNARSRVSKMETRFIL
jgi:hypothetical protein